MPITYLNEAASRDFIENTKPCVPILRNHLNALIKSLIANYCNSITTLEQMNGVNLTAASQLSGADGIPICPPVPPIDGDEDAQTIYRLENECYKLRVSMSKVRKATQEWFFLETRLKNATDELDAAKEDRDLMLGGGDVCFGTEIDAIANNKTTNNNNDNSNSNTCSAGPLVVPLTPIKSEAQKQREKIEQDLQRIEVQLNVHPKFSPEWFKLKEELVELRIKLDEGDSAKNKSNGSSSNNNINNSRN